MAILEANTDLDIKGKVLATDVPNSTGSIVTWNASTKVFGLRTNAQIIADLNLSSNYITTNTTQTGLSGNKTSSGIWTLGQIRKAGQNDTQILLAGGGHRPVSDFALAGSLGDYLPLTGGTLTGNLSISAGNTDKYITFDYNGTNTYNWRIGYLGTGSGNANYFTIQSSKSTGGVYFDALRLELDTLNAHFLGTVTAPTFIGALSGNASTATTLVTARTINGTSFNGSANITTARWGTARNITIGNTTKSVNGSANVSWSLAEIGAASSTSLSDYVPYTGANQPIDLNNQRFISQKGIRVDNGHSDIFAVQSMYESGQKKVIIKIENPSQTGTLMGDYNVHIFRYSGRSYTFNVTMYKYNSLFHQPTVRLTNGNSEDIVAVKFLHDGNGVLYLEFDFTTTANYVSVMLTNGNFLNNYSDHTTEWTITNDIIFDTSPLILQITRFPSQFIRDSYLWNKGDFTQTNIDNWNTAFGWGNHASVGYAVSGTGTSQVRNNSQLDARYLQLTGGTMGNTATIYWSGADYTSGIIHKHRNVSSGGLAIGRMSTNTHDKGFGLSTTGDFIFGDWSDISNLSTSWNTVWHSGNLTNVSQLNNDAGYLTSSNANYIAIGNGSQTGTSNGNAETLRNGSIWSTPTTGGIPSSNGAVVSFNPYTNGNYGFQLGARGNKFYGRTLENGTLNNWVEFIHTGNISSSLSGYVPTSRTLTAGNGLSGGGNLTANRTITLGTPSAITLSSTNSVTTSSHTHAFTPGGTTAQYIRGDGSLATMPSFTDAITSISRNGVNIPIVSQNVDIPIFSTSGAGLVPPRVGSVATKYLREDGTWVTPTNTTYSAGTLALLQAGTNTSNRIWSAKILADYVTSMIPTTILSYSSANGIIVTDWNSYALSQYAMSLGYGSVTSGNYATSVGGLLSTTGFGSTNQGYSNSITKSLGYALGAYNSVRATLSGAFGIGLINRNDGAFVVGRYNSELPIEPYDTTSPHKQAVFAIGAGRDETDRYTALTVYGDGRADYTEGYDDSTWTNSTLVTKKWVLDNVGGSSGGGGGVGYRNVRTSEVFDLSSEYSTSLAESVFHVMTDKPVVFIGGNEVFHDGYKVTIMVSDDRIDISLDNTQGVKFMSGEYSLISYLDQSTTSVTFIYDKEYSLFRVYHISYTSGL